MQVLDRVLRNTGRRLAATLRSRRGVTSTLVASVGSVLIGMAAIATEGGTWYVVLRNASTATDLAAFAGASARDRGGDAVAIALDAAARNGFRPDSATTVAAYNPHITGPQVGNIAAVEVVVTRRPTLHLSATLLGTPPVIRSRAVAVSRADDEVCMLALNRLELGGNSTTQASRCVLAGGSGGINVYGSASVRAAALASTGTCTGCASGDVWTDDTRSVRPLVIADRQEPISDPFRSLSNWTPSPPPCRTTAISGSNVSITPGQGAICTGVTIGTNDRLNLSPGIYYFNNADLTVRGQISGEGVTLVFTGDSSRVGTIQINAQATGTLSGPTSSLIPGHPEASGLVIYRDWAATNNGTAKEVQLNGGATMLLRGGVYLPTSDVVVNGKSDLGSDCLSIVANNLSLSGASDTEVGVTGCAGYTPYPTLRTVRLVE
jgi:hypothetical protein